MRGTKLVGRPFTVVDLAAAVILTAVTLLLVFGLGHAQAQVPDPVTLQMHTIASTEPGINLSLREKRLASHSSFSSDRVVLLLEPFGVPAAESFDCAIPGFNLMDYLAERGYDVWALDFRGFGASDRSAVFSQPMMANPPQLRASDAVLDVDTAMGYICGQRSVVKSNLLGWSWGAVVASEYAGLHPEKIERLVSYGGMHAFLLPSITVPMTNSTTGLMNPLPAYQLAVPSMSINHWNMQAMGGMVPHTPEAEAELSRIFLASDATSGTRTPPSIRRAMGPMVDLYEIWSGRPVFDASLIKAPTLIIRGDHDTFSNDPGFITALTNAPVKRYVEIPLATHWAIYEPGAAPTLMSEISRFLTSGRPSLTLSMNNAYWVSYADYQSGTLNADYRINNTGTDTGYNLRVTGSTATDGASLAAGAPVALGDVSGGSGVSFTLRYLVPASVSRLRTFVNASAEDGGGVSYNYPNAAPVV